MATLPPDTRAVGTPDPANDMNSVVDCLVAVTGAAAGGGTVTAQGTINTLTGTQTAGKYLRSNGTNAVLASLAAADLTGTAAIANGGTGQATAAAALAALGAPVLQAATAVAGYTLVNGTGNIVTWTPPSDSALHMFNVIAVLHVTSAETGGSIQITWSTPDGTSTTTSVFAGGQTGVQSFSQQKLCQAGTAVTVAQNTALTAGAAVAWVQLWGL